MGSSSSRDTSRLCKHSFANVTLVYFAKTVSSNKSFCPFKKQAASRHCASFQMLLSAGSCVQLLVLKIIMVIEALLHPSLLLLFVLPFCELTPKYSRLMTISYYFNYPRRRRRCNTAPTWKKLIVFCYCQ